MSTKYTSLNVLNYGSKLKSLEDRDAIAEVSAMLGASGSRSQRRKLEKALNKTEKILARCEKTAKSKAEKELEIRADENFMYLFACVGLTLNEDYHWKEDPEQDHGQLTSFFERLTKKIESYADKGMSTEDIINLLDERTGIQLVSTMKK